MALIFKCKSYPEIRVNSNEIFGLIGNNYVNFIDMINDSNTFIIKKSDDFFTNSINSEINLYNNDENAKKIVLEAFNLDVDYLNRKINNLSSGEKRLLKYVLAFISNKKIIIIDEPFLDMDYNIKKKIKSLLKRIAYETNKIIIIGSMDSDLIYEMCNNVVILDKTCYCGHSKEVFTNESLLKKYHIDMPRIVEFINLIKKKNILIDYSFDIRDLIKDVYKSV